MDDMSLIERDKTLAVALDCAPGRLTARILDAKAGRIVGEVEYVPASDLQGADRSLMLEVCSHCGERAGGATHGHTDAPDWRWLRVEYVRADQLAGAVKALQGIRVTLEARDTDPDAAGVAYDAAGHALAALNALGGQ